jgi:hypothetical protein
VHRRPDLSRRLHALGAFFLTLLFVFVGCQDTTSPDRSRIRVGSPAFDEYDSYSDTLDYCAQFECREVTGEEAYRLNLVWDAIQGHLAPWCANMKNQLGLAIDSNRIKVAAHFPSATQLGATSPHDWNTYIRADRMVNTDLLTTPLGHEMLHQAGYGRYSGHQTQMDDLANGCMGNWQ